MKKLLLILGLILIPLGLDIIIFQQSISVAAAYFLGALLLIFYSRVFEKVTRLVHAVISIIFAIPIVMIAFLIIYGSIHTTDFDEDVVFVLGAGLQNDTILPGLQARLDQALVYFESNPDAMFIVCGGYGEGQTISEARAMADFLIAGGVPFDQIIIEDLSTSTYENFAFAIELLDAYFPDGFSSVVITNNFHMYRAGYLARHFGIYPTRFGARTPILAWNRSFVREFMAVFNTWLFQT